MTRLVAIVAAGFLIIAGLAGSVGALNGGPLISAAFAEASANRQVLYWKDPDGKNYFSDTPKKTPDGRDYVPVYEGEEAVFEQSKPKKAPTNRKILYYRNPMGLADVSPVPKKDSMGMDYIPVYEGEDDESGIVKIAPGKIQRTGVQSEMVMRRVLNHDVRAPAVIDADEHKQTVVVLRFEAFLNGLEHITTGSTVHKGEPLMRVFGQTLSSAAAEYVTELGLRDKGGLPTNRGARQKLENLGVPEDIIKEMERTRQAPLTVVWPAPRDGVIVEHNVVEGMMAKPGDVLFRIADLSVVWALVDVAERDLELIAPGQTVTVTPRGYPGYSFAGKISLIYPVLAKETRTARLRVILDNPKQILKSNMYADAVISTGREQPVLAVPDSAIISSGTHQIVLLDRGEGRFEPRDIKTGARGNGYVEVKEGVREHEKVVVSANFLIDAESNLKAALKGLTAGGEVK